MPRRTLVPASVAAEIARVAAGERPAWIDPATWRRLRALAGELRDDAHAAIRAGGVVGAAEALGVHRDTMHAWRTRGWLAPADE